MKSRNSHHTTYEWEEGGEKWKKSSDMKYVILPEK